jgi:hypothetical protein
MRLPLPEPCAAAIRAGEARLEAAEELASADSRRYQEQGEAIRKAWQVVLCAQWEIKRKRELPGAADRTQSRPYARSHGTA